MSTPTKRPRPKSLADLQNHHLPAKEGAVPYHVQLIEQIDKLFAEQPEKTDLLIGIDLLSFALRTDETKLVTALRSKGMSYQVVRFGGKTGQDTGVLVSRKLPEPTAVEVAAEPAAE